MASEGERISGFEPDEQEGLERIRRTRIPKILHVIWIGPHDPPERCIDSWRQHHPPSRDWTFKLWRDHQGFVNQDVINKILFHKRDWRGAAYVMGWEILASRHGGILVQADSECVRPLDEVGDPGQGPGFFDLEAWAHYEHEGLRPGVLACGAMGSSSYAEVFARCVEQASKANIADGGNPWFTVGPGLLAKIAATLPKDRLTVLPARMFAPDHHSGAKAPGDAPIFAKQMWASTRPGGYNGLRRCTCHMCGISALRPPWG